MTRTAETHRLAVTPDESIVVDWIPPAEPGGRTAVFLHGLASDRKGDKALYFANRFAEKGWGFLTLDMRGHGDADGQLRDLTMTRCLEDLTIALEWLKEQGEGEPPLLIESSMGGAVAAWRHLDRPKETGPLVLIAPSLQFPGRLGWQLGPAVMEEWKNTGVRKFESQWSDLEIGFGLMEDALSYDPQKILVAFQTPTLIFHGMKDDAVDWRISQTFVEDCAYPHMELVLLKNGDHRLTDHKEFLFETLWGWLANHPMIQNS